MIFAMGMLQYSTPYYVMITYETNWSGNKNTVNELLCSLKPNSLKTGTKQITIFAFWFDNNKELNYPFLGMLGIHGSSFLMISRFGSITI